MMAADFQYNADDLVAYVHSGDVFRSHTQLTGMILVDRRCPSMAQVMLCDPDEADTELGNTFTAQAAIVSNMFIFWDCTTEKKVLLKDPSLTYCLLLECASVAAVHDVDYLPHGFDVRMRRPISGLHDVFRFSAFDAASQRRWLECLSAAVAISCRAHSPADLAAGGAAVENGRSEAHGNSAGHAEGSPACSSEASSPTAAAMRLDCSHAPPPAINEIESAALLTNWIRHRHQLAVGAGRARRTIVCEEWMAECRLSLAVPAALLRLYRQWAVDLRAAIDARLYFVPNALLPQRDVFMSLLSADMERYADAMDFLDHYQPGVFFRPSVDKVRVSFAYSPINLHLQRFYVATVPEPDAKPVWRAVDAWTHGSCAAIPLRYDASGGLVQLQSELCAQLGADTFNAVVDDQRFWAHRLDLLDARRKLAAVGQELDRRSSNGGDNDLSSTAKAMALALCQMKEIDGKLKDFISTCPAIVSWCDSVVSAGADYHSQQSARPATLELHSAPSSVAVPKQTLDTLCDNSEALLISLSTKVAAMDTSNEKGGVGEDSIKDSRAVLESASQVAKSAIKTLDTLADTLEAAQLFGLVQCCDSRPTAERINSLRARCDIVHSMALSVVCSVLLKPFWVQHTPGADGQVASCEGDQVLWRALGHWDKCGALLTLASHLSCYGDERHMLLESAWAFRSIRSRVRFRFVKMADVPAGGEREKERTGHFTATPVVEGTRAGLLVSLPLTGQMFQRLPSPLCNGADFPVNAILFNVGINHEAYFGAKLGENQALGLPQVERELNVSGARLLAECIDAAMLASTSATGADGDGADCDSGAAAQDRVGLRRANQLADRLLDQVGSEASNKRTVILRLAVDATLAAGGQVSFMCKSGKDRTALAVTLHETLTLRETAGLAEKDLYPTLDTLRKHSVRLENCRKNVGHAMYAISSFQIPFLPKEYRPPADLRSAIVFSWWNTFLRCHSQTLVVLERLGVVTIPMETDANPRALDTGNVSMY